MGWLFWKPSSNSSSGNPEPARAPDGGAVAPNRSARQQCWVARDRFFTCLDTNAIVDSLRDDGAARACCGSEIAAFEGACSKAWVKYFKEKRVMEYNREQTIARIKQDEDNIATVQKSKSQ